MLLVELFHLPKAIMNFGEMTAFLGTV